MKEWHEDIPSFGKYKNLQKKIKLNWVNQICVPDINPLKRGNDFNCVSWPTS